MLWLQNVQIVNRITSQLKQYTIVITVYGQVAKKFKQKGDLIEK